MKSEWRTVKLLWFVNTLEGQTNTHTHWFLCLMSTPTTVDITHPLTL